MSAADFDLIFFPGLSTFAPSIGTAGNDTILGTIGNDAIYGLAGGDILAGAAGNDLIIGGPDADVLFASTGPGSTLAPDGPPPLNFNVLEGGPGNDIMLAGPAGDFFYFGSGSGPDIIGGFVPAADVIVVLQGINGLTIPSNADFLTNHVADGPFGVVVDFTGGNSVRIDGVTKASLTTANILISPV